MTIPPDLEARILRYYHVEKWRVGTIAKQLRVHPETVGWVLAQAGLPRIGPPRRASKIDPYLPFIRETLAKFPTLTASRLQAMVCERGYRGGKSRFRAIIACHRPRPPAEAYLRLRTLPGEQAQCDWGHFGHVTIGRARRPLMAFVLVLSYSRHIFLRFFLDARTENFLRGHLAAFTAWQGVPRVILYDNLRSAVLERHGDAIRFNPTLLDFAAHYRYDPRPVAIARGNEKGRVERAIRFVRDAFFAARAFTDLDDLNAQSLPLRRRGPMPGVAAWPMIAAVPRTQPAASARSSPKRRRCCSACPTIRIRSSSGSRSRSTRRPMSGSTRTTTRYRIQRFAAS